MVTPPHDIPAGAEQLPPAIRVEYPFRSRWWGPPGERLHYLDEGSGPAVVCVHGNPTWSFAFRGLVKALSGRFRVIVPDHLGMGLSDNPPGHPFRLDGRIAALRGLLDDLRLDRFHLVVHDWGGPIGLGAALARPEQIGRVVILNTAAFPARRMPWQIALCRPPLLGELLIRGLNAFAGPAVTLATTKGLAPAVRAGYLWPYRSWAARRAVARFVADIPMSPEHPSWEALREVEISLPRLQGQRVLLAWGMRDFCFTPWFLRRWREYVPLATVHEFPDAGHYVFEDAAPELEALALDWLAR